MQKRYFGTIKIILKLTNRASGSSFVRARLGQFRIKLFVKVVSSEDFLELLSGRIPGGGSASRVHAVTIRKFTGRRAAPCTKTNV